MWLAKCVGPTVPSAPNRDLKQYRWEWIGGLNGMREKFHKIHSFVFVLCALCDDWLIDWPIFSWWFHFFFKRSFIWTAFRFINFYIYLRKRDELNENNVFVTCIAKLNDFIVCGTFKRYTILYQQYNIDLIYHRFQWKRNKYLQKSPAICSVVHGIAGI